MLPRPSALRPLSVSCPLFFQLLSWPLATAASTAPRPCPPGKEPNLVSPPCPSASPGKAVEGRGRDPRPGSLALSSLFASCRNQGRSHCAGPAPQAPSQPPGALARASPTHAAALEGGSRPRWARQFRTRCVETASLGEPWGGARGFTQDLRSWGLSLTPPLSGPQTSHV